MRLPVDEEQYPEYPEYQDSDYLEYDNRNTAGRDHNTNQRPGSFLGFSQPALSRSVIYTISSEISPSISSHNNNVLVEFNEIVVSPAARYTVLLVVCGRICSALCSIGTSCHRIVTSAAVIQSPASDPRPAAT